MNKLRAKEIYYLMVLGRSFEYAAKEHYMQGDISGFLHLDIGQEALSVASIKAFEKGDVFSGYREHVMAIAKGIEPKAIMAELFGKATGVSGGKGGSMHLFSPEHCFYGGDAIVGGHLPNAVGCAYARKFQESQEGVMAIFGDGATNGGAFFESLNIASTHKLPLLFLCENNEYAIGTHITRAAPFKEQANRAKPFMPTLSCDGMDAQAVFETVTQAKNYIEEGHGPIFVEAFTCRFEGHSMSDANRYRSAQEMQHCKAKDPIPRLEEQLLHTYECSKEELIALQNEAQQTIEETVAFAKQSPQPDITSLKDHIFAQERNNALS